MPLGRRSAAGAGGSREQIVRRRGSNPKLQENRPTQGSKLERRIQRVARNSPDSSFGLADDLEFYYQSCLGETMNTLQPHHCRHPLALFTLVLVVLTTSASHPSLKANAVAVQSTLDHNLNSLSLMWRSLKANAVPMQFTPTPRTTTRITVASDGS